MPWLKAIDVHAHDRSEDIAAQRLALQDAVRHSQTERAIFGIWLSSGFTVRHRERNLALSAALRRGHKKRARCLSA